MDIADRAQRIEELARAHALARHQARRADADGTFCATCGEPIPLARRVALAGASRCVACQEERERASRR